MVHLDFSSLTFPSGTLKSVPLIPDAEEGVQREFLVSLSGLSITNQTGTTTAITASSFNTTVLLDSGTTLCYLPTAVVNAFATIFNAVTTQGVLVVDCAFRTAQTKGYISFSFGGSGGPTIQVPIAEMVLPIDGTNKCRLGMKGQSSGTFILGDTFLRSAYVVFNLDYDTAALAQSNFDSSISNVVEFKASDNGIPALTGQSTGTTQEPGVTGSKSAATAPVPPFQAAPILVFALSAALSLVGGMMFLA
jgi:hypothetical protein